MGGLAFVNGKHVALKDAYVHVEDRGYQFGDGIYEVVYAYNHVPFALKEHLDRFMASLAAVRIKPCYTREQMESIIRESLVKSKLEMAEIYWQMTRGTYKRAHSFPPTEVKSNFVLIIHPAKPFDVRLWEEGVPVKLVQDIRWGNCRVKSVNLLPNVLAKQEARENGYFEALLHRNGMITEGSSTNVFMVVNGELYTAPMTSNILGGITRMHVIEMAEQLNIPVREEPFSVEQLQNADEAFLTGTWIEVLPINKIDAQTINQGQVGPITRALQKAYRERITKECR